MQKAGPAEPDPQQNHPYEALAKRPPDSRRANYAKRTAYFMRLAISFAKATGSSSGIPSTNKAWLYSKLA